MTGDGCCKQDYFFNEFNESEDSCESCNELMPFSEALECHEPGIMLANLPLAKGYWRSSNESTIIRQCLFEDACKGGSEIGGSNDYCADGYQGPCKSSHCISTFEDGSTCRRKW